jgi:hypothetical protein
MAVRRPRRGSFLVLAALAVALSSCQVDRTPAAATSAATSPAATPSSTVPAVLDFSAPLLSGGSFDGSSLRGKDVAFWFWAPW